MDVITLFTFAWNSNFSSLLYAAGNFIRLKMSSASLQKIAVGNKVSRSVVRQLNKLHISRAAVSVTISLSFWISNQEDVF